MGLGAGEHGDVLDAERKLGLRVVVPPEELVLLLHVRNLEVQLQKRKIRDSIKVTINICKEKK